MKKRISLNKTWYGLIVLITLLPMMVLLVWMGHRAHTLLLKNAILKEKQHNDEIKTNVNQEFNRIITLLQNKSDPMAFTLSGPFDEDLLRNLFEAVFSRESAINSLSLVSSESRMVLGMDRYGKVLNIIEGNVRSPGHEDNYPDYAHLFDTKSPEIVIPLHGRTYVSSPSFKEGKTSFKIGMSVGPSGHPIAALIASVSTAELWKNIQAVSSHSGVNTYLVDSHGCLLVTPTGKLITYLDIVRTVITNRDWDSIESYTGLNGERVFGVASYIDTLNWGVISEIPGTSITGPIYKILLSMAGIIFAIVFLFGGMGLLFVNRLLKPFSSLRTSFDRVADGDYTTKITLSGVKEIDTIAEGFNSMTHVIGQRENEIKALNEFLEQRVIVRTEKLNLSLKEKEVLLKEIHHRVKNNMQVISSLLNLQSKKIKDKQLIDIFKESQNRVKSMALIHETLYQSESLANINIANYIRKLTNSLIKTYVINPNSILLKIDIDNLFLSVETAIPCGLIINELFSNSLKYAFPAIIVNTEYKPEDSTQREQGGPKGEICISFSIDNNKYTLVYSDNGVGLPEGLDFKKSKTLGLDLVNTLTDQIDGTIELDRSNGTEFKITFEV